MRHREHKQVLIPNAKADICTSLFIKSDSLSAAIFTFLTTVKFVKLLTKRRSFDEKAEEFLRVP